MSSLDLKDRKSCVESLEAESSRKGVSHQEVLFLLPWRWKMHLECEVDILNCSQEPHTLQFWKGFLPPTALSEATIANLTCPRLVWISTTIYKIVWRDTGGLGKMQCSWKWSWPSWSGMLPLGWLQLWHAVRSQYLVVPYYSNMQQKRSLAFCSLGTILILFF